jgi:hypothetical protein
MDVINIVTQPPYPQVVVTNHAMAHSLNDFQKFTDKFSTSEGAFWKDYVKNRTSQSNASYTPLPQYMIFQNGKCLTGKRNHNFHWSSDNFRRSSNYVKKELHPLGFRELDEYTLTAGRYDNYGEGPDGWHFWGSTRQMEAVMFFNMICNP